MAVILEMGKENNDNLCSGCCGKNSESESESSYSNLREQPYKTRTPAHLESTQVVSYQS
jgi:hypothetical protein